MYFKVLMMLDSGCQIPDNKKKFSNLSIRHLVSGIWYLFLFLITQNLFAQTTENLLLKEINTLAADPVLKYGQLAVSLRSLKTGQSVVAENAVKNMAPASNLKLLTTAAALGILGENYTFQTLLEYDGELKDSILYGNLYITGSGDPSLGSDRYKGFPAWEELIGLWTKKIKEAGIKRVKGAVVADPTVFDQSPIPDPWPWGDIGNYYGAGVYGLNLNENLYRLYFKGTTEGDSAKLVRTSPTLTGVKFVNEVKTGPPASGDKAYVYAAPWASRVYMNGTIPANADQFAVRGSVPDPPLLCASLLSSALSAQNIAIEKSAYVLSQKKQTDLARKLIYLYNSPPLKEIVKQTNVNSINLNAEALLKTCGRKRFSDPKLDAGIKAIQEFWKQKGMDITGWFMYDGSGLSPNNGISASQMSKALYLISKDSVYNSFYASIPIAGQTGTVYRLGKGTAAEGNVRVKSGTLSKVICYSGYVKSKSGEMYSFSILSSGYNCTNSAIIGRLEKILVRMAEMP
ncbi:MAG TPA: D-alanyl-D-alanine carboxypeptidase/D-alanyl-D-alanine-endopeptidase [Cytophagaceae bacterium]|nr:D-alanyl-D-alanine carboxypeptidase/D-alanyl-D-alanine-endopeptidase [Cytophagaceae bacterium]